MTEKQRLQKDRAYFKFVIAGLPKPIQTRSLSEEECVLWNTILDSRKQLLTIYEDTSKELGLKVPEHRCWCGKEAKLEIEEFGKFFWVCNKHKLNIN